MGSRWLGSLFLPAASISSLRCGSKVHTTCTLQSRRPGDGAGCMRSGAPSAEARRANSIRCFPPRSATGVSRDVLLLAVDAGLLATRPGIPSRCFRCAGEAPSSQASGREQLQRASVVAGSSRTSRSRRPGIQSQAWAGSPAIAVGFASVAQAGAGACRDCGGIEIVKERGSVAWPSGSSLGVIQI